MAERKRRELTDAQDEAPIETGSPSALPFDVEHEVIIRRYPHEFQMIPAQLNDLGPGKPRIVLDFVTDDE